MARVTFTAHLREQIPVSTIEVDGENVREVLDRVFDQYPRLRSYVLEDSAALRKHVLVFIGETMIRDRSQLSDPVAATDEVFVLQSLTGG